MRRIEGALWLPRTRYGAEGGLFEPSGRAVTEALTFRGIPNPHTPLGPLFTTESGQGLRYIRNNGLRFIHLGTVNRHYGHFLIGAVARMWCLPVAARRSLRFVYDEGFDVDTMFSFAHIAAIWRALGLSREHFVAYSEGVVFESIDVPGLAFEENSHVHALYADLMMQIGDRLVCEPVAHDPHRVVYLTKQHLHTGIWSLVNEAELTAILAARGVEIVAPEKLSLGEQIRLWRGGGTFIATSGSALHTALFTSKSRLICLNDSADMWSNQVLIDAVTLNNSLYLYDPETIISVPPRPGFLRGILSVRPVQTALQLLQWAEMPSYRQEAAISTSVSATVPIC